MKKALMCIGLLVVLLAMLSPLYMASFLDYWTMRGATPAQKTGYGEWRKQRLVIPPGALDVMPFRKDTQAAVLAFHQTWAKQYEYAEQMLRRHYFKGNAQQSYCLGSAMSDAMRYSYTKASTDTLFLAVRPENIDLPESKRDLVRMQPVLEAFKKAISQPDYEIAAFYTPGFDHKGRMFFDSIIKLMRLKAFTEIRERRYDAAMETAQDMVRAAKGSAYDVYSLQVNSAETFWLGVDTWREVVEACPDVGLLRLALRRQNELVGKQHFYTKYLPATDPDSGYSSGTLLLFAPRKLTFENVNAISGIRFYKRIGYKPDLEKAITMHPMMASDYMQLKYIEDVELTMAEKAGDEDQIKGIKDNMKDLQYFTSIFSNYRYVSLQQFYFHRIKMEVVMARGKVVRTHFDLLRLRTAEKVFALERGKQAERLGDLLPGLLEEAPFDRFSKDRRDYGRSDKGFYSVGPDGADERGALAYDATNGTMSVGDIWR